MLSANGQLFIGIFQIVISALLGAWGLHNIIVAALRIVAGK